MTGPADLVRRCALAKQFLTFVSRGAVPARGRARPAAAGLLLHRAPDGLRRKRDLLCAGLRVGRLRRLPPARHLLRHHRRPAARLRRRRGRSAATCRTGRASWRSRTRSSTTTPRPARPWCASRSASATRSCRRRSTPAVGVRVTTRTWLDPAWRAGAEAWATDRLAEHGLSVVGRSSSRTWRPGRQSCGSPTDQGPFWFKASAPGTAYEHRMFGVLAGGRTRARAHASCHRRRPGLVAPSGCRHEAPGPARDPPRRTVRALGRRRRRPRSPAAGPRPARGRLLALGVPDMRPEAVPARPPAC